MELLQSYYSGLSGPLWNEELQFRTPFQWYLPCGLRRGGLRVHRYLLASRKTLRWRPGDPTMAGVSQNVPYAQ